MLDKRLDKAIHLMADKNLDALLIGPGSDLKYFTGLNPSTDERFKALFILKNGDKFYICPELYLEETEEILNNSIEIFCWSDGEGFIKAIKDASAKYNIKNIKIGINDTLRAVDILEINNFIDTNFVLGTEVMENIRMIKTKDEIKHLKEAANIADRVFSDIVKFIRPGIMERDIKNKIEELFMEKGAEGLSFDTIVASGPNSSKPHYNDDSRVIEKNDIIILDFGCKYNGYCSDMSRTVFVGTPTEEQRKIYNIVLDANMEAEKFAEKGVTAGDVDKTARDIIDDAGYGKYFINRTGHGIGMDVHEGPYIKEKNALQLDNGMAFSIEPGIYLPGKYGMRVEDIVIIEDGKSTILNNSPKDMTIL